MTRRFRWGSGVTGVAVAAIGFWAVLSPSSFRALISRLSPVRLVAGLSAPSNGAVSGRVQVCTDSLRDVFPGPERPDNSGSVDERHRDYHMGASTTGVRRGTGASRDDRTQHRSMESGTGAGPMVSLGPSPGLHEYLQGELSYLTILRQLHRELRRTVTGLWAARARRRRALEAWEAACRRVDAQKARVKRRRKELSSFFQALYKLVDGWQDVAFLDRRRTTPPLDGRMELVAVIAHFNRELRAETRILASLIQERERARMDMDEAKSQEASLDALRDSLKAKIARAQQELSDVRRSKEQRNRSREVWDRRARRLHKAVVEIEEELRILAEGFDSLKGKLLRPVPGIVLPYPGSRRHKAVLLGAEPGWWARAPARGRIVFAGPVAGFGKVVILDHGEGFTSVVGYLSHIDVKVGDRVRKGRPLGRVAGPKGLVTRKKRYCYYELRRSGFPLDPFEWLRFSGRRGRAPRLRHRPRLPTSLPSAVADRLIPGS